MKTKRMHNKIYLLLALFIFTFVLSIPFAIWQDRASDPRVDHLLWGIMIFFHILAFICLVGMAAVFIYKQVKRKESRVDIILSCILAFLLVGVIGFAFFGYDALGFDLKYYEEYQLIDISNSDQNLVVREKYLLWGSTVYVYTEKNGKAGKYLGTIHGEESVNWSFKSENFQAYDNGDGTITLRWNSNPEMNNADWKEATFDLNE